MLSGCSSIKKSWKSQFSVVLFSCRQCLRILSVWGVSVVCLWCLEGVWVLYEGSWVLSEG